MSSNHAPQSLGDYVQLQRGTTYQSALLGLAGPVLLGLGSIARNGGFRPGGLKTYGGSSDPKILLQPGDIYVSLKDVTQSADLLGAVARVPETVACGRLTQDTVKLIFRHASAPTDYIYWLLQTPDYRSYCRAHATGTTNLGLARDDFFAFPVPPLTVERTTIVNALQALNEKIELNRRINETLEAIARAIFEEAGRASGWQPRPLNEYAAIFDGPHATPSLTPKGPIFLGISNLKSGMLDLSDTNHLSEADFQTWTRRVTPTRGDVVFSYETRLGQAALIPQGLRCCLGRRMGLLRPHRDRVAPVVLLRAYLSADFQEVIRKHTIHGATVERIPLKDMGDFPIRLPDPSQNPGLADQLAALRNLVEANQRESATLAATRDLLLPRLMSGELRVKDAERAVEEAA